MKYEDDGEYYPIGVWLAKSQQPPHGCGGYNVVLIADEGVHAGKEYTVVAPSGAVQDYVSDPVYNAWAELVGQFGWWAAEVNPR